MTATSGICGSQSGGQIVKAYPQSQWRQQAEQRIERLQREYQQRKEEERREAILAEQRRQLQQQGKVTTSSALDSNVTGGSSIAPIENRSARSKPAADSKDRVTRALAIYQKQRQQEQQERYQQQQQQARNEEIQQKCNQIQDQIKQYGRSRLRWYELDESGERVFLSKEQVAANKRRLESQYQQRCQ